MSGEGFVLETMLSFLSWHASAKVAKGFHIACSDLKPPRRFVVNAGQVRFTEDIEAIGERALAEELCKVQGGNDR